MRLERVTVNGVGLHFARDGQGPPALLLHGYGHAYTMWLRVVKDYLRDNYSCYLVDLPGHGASAKPPLEWYTLDNFTQTLHQFCLKLGLEKCLLLGYSMGGLLGLNLAINYPKLVENLVTINSPICGDFLSFLDPFLHLERLAQRRWAKFFLRFYTAAPPFTSPVEVRRYAHLKMLFSQSCRRVQMELGQCTPQSLFGCYKMLRQVDLSQQLNRLCLPILVIVSRNDKVVPPEQSYTLHEQVTAATLAIITDSGHLPLDEQPDLFDRVLQNYLNIGLNHHLNNSPNPVIL